MKLKICSYIPIGVWAWFPRGFASTAVPRSQSLLYVHLKFKSAYPRNFFNKGIIKTIQPSTKNKLATIINISPIFTLEAVNRNAQIKKMIHPHT